MLKLSSPSLKFLLTSITSLLESLSGPLLQILLTSVYLKYLGVDEYVFIVLLQSINAFVGITVFGPSITLTEIIGSNNQDVPDSRHWQSIQGVVLFYVCVYLFLWFIILSLIPILDNIGFIPSIFSSISSISFTLTYLFFFSLFSNLDHLLSCALKGLGKVFFASSLEASLNTFFLILASLIAFLSQDLHITLCYLLFTRILKLSVKVVCLFRAIGMYSPVSFRGLIPLFKNTIKHSFSLNLGLLGSMFSNNADKLILTYFIASSELALYSVAVRIASQLHTLCQGALSWVVYKYSPRLTMLSTRLLLKLFLFNWSISFLSLLVFLRIVPFVLPFLFPSVDISAIGQYYFPLVFGFFLLSVSSCSFYLSLASSLKKQTSFLSFFGGLSSALFVFLFAADMGSTSAVYSK